MARFRMGECILRRKPIEGGKERESGAATGQERSLGLRQST